MTISMTVNRLGATAGIVLAFGLAFSAPAYSAGGDSSSPPDKTETTEKCKNGQVWDKNKKKCVAAEESGFNDDDLYKAARELAYAGQYDHAIRILKLAKNQEDPRILNYLGFSNRKAGRVDVAMDYYRRAIAIDGNYILARSYMGQALVDQGLTREARLQLIEIRDRGGENTWAYRALAQALDTGITY